jgi:hypothetical protein
VGGGGGGEGGETNMQQIVALVLNTKHHGFYQMNLPYVNIITNYGKSSVFSLIVYMVRFWREGGNLHNIDINEYIKLSPCREMRHTSGTQMRK